MAFETDLTTFNKVQMRKWRDLLRQAHRDGTPQTRGVLKRLKATVSNTNGYCCMGIWTDHAADQGRLRRESPDPTLGVGSQVISYYEPGSDRPESAELTSSEAAILGVATDPYLLYTEVRERPDTEAGYREGDTRFVQYSAAELNDGLHLNFDQIADCMTWTYGLDA